MSLGRLPAAPVEARLAVTLFLLLLGVADLFGAWQVRNFASFSPAGVARTMASPHSRGGESASDTVTEVPVDLGALDRPQHRIHRELLVQDTHVHIPVYAMAAAFLSVIVLGLRMSSGTRSTLIALAFAAPVLDFAGLWGAQLAPRASTAFGALAVAGGVAMGLLYLVVLAATLWQCWFRRTRE